MVPCWWTESGLGALDLKGLGVGVGGSNEIMHAETLRDTHLKGASKLAGEGPPDMSVVNSHHSFSGRQLASAASESGRRWARVSGGAVWPTGPTLSCCSRGNTALLTFFKVNGKTLFCFHWLLIILCVGTTTKTLANRFASHRLPFASGSRSGRRPGMPTAPRGTSP